MRTTLVAFACLSLCLVAAGCRVSVETKTEFKGADVTKTAVADYAGQAIVIKQDGVGAASGTSGLRVVASSATTKIQITATPISLAFDEDKTQAEAQVAEVGSAISIDESVAGTITINCPHPAASKASAASGEAGCKYATVLIPAGTLAKPITLDARVGNGDFTLEGDPFLGGSSALAANGAGDLAVRFQPAKGASILVQGGFAMSIGLPSAVAIDNVSFRGDVEELDATAFGLTAAGGAIGTAGTGAASLIVDHGTTGLDAVVLSKF